MKGGDVAYGGDVIRARPTHIQKGHLRDNLYTGKKERFDPNQVFLSPVSEYAIDHYASEQRWTDMAAARSPYTVRMALQVRVRPGCYKVGQETVFAGARAIDPTGTYPNSQVEWYTKETAGVLITGLLVKCTPA